MTIFICTNASPRIRGELTRFLYEIDAGVYVGKINAEVRNLLFDKIEQLSIDLSDFRLIMIYSYKNENGFEYKYLNYKNYKLENIDGLILPIYISQNSKN